MHPPAARDQYPSQVVENAFICREHYRLVLRLPQFPPTEPGQFVQVACRDTGISYSPERELDCVEGEPLGTLGVELMQPLAFLRRPFSLAGRSDGVDGVRLELIHRIVGVGTQWLSELKAEDIVDVLGPLGNRFRLPSEGEVPLLVGGGVGIPPMLYLAQKLMGKLGGAFCGALTRDLLPLTVVGGGAAPFEDSIEPL